MSGKKTIKINPNFLKVSNKRKQKKEKEKTCHFGVNDEIQ